MSLGVSCLKEILLILDLIWRTSSCGKPYRSYCFLRLSERAEAEEADPNLGAVNRDAQPTDGFRLKPPEELALPLF